ncbi:MAG: hypothetical protein ACR2MO_08115 [Acidimicrobiales bacterium]
MAEDTYVVAVRRSQRGLAPDDWLDRVRTTEGVSVVGSSSGRAQIRADDLSLARLRSELGSFLHIEPAIAHFGSEPEVPRRA